MRTSRSRRWAAVLTTLMLTLGLSALPAQAAQGAPARKTAYFTTTIPLNGSRGFQYYDAANKVCVRAGGSLTISYQIDYYFELGIDRPYQVSHIRIVSNTSSPNGTIITFTHTCGATSGGSYVMTKSSVAFDVYDQDCVSVWSGAVSIPWGVSIGLTHTCSTVSRAALAGSATGSSTMIDRTVNGLNATLSDNNRTVTLDYQLGVAWSIKIGTTTYSSSQPFFGSMFFSCSC